MPQAELQGSVLALVLYDVGEAIQLEELRERIAGQRVERALKHAAPEYVRYERPPVIQPLEPVRLESGRLEGRIKYYDYGVVSLILELPFAGDWEALLRLASRWMWEPELERRASEVAREQVRRAGTAVVKPYPNWLSEDYFIFHLREVAGRPTGAQLLAESGEKIARLVRGETVALSADERAEILRTSISYYPEDVAVIGWNAAVVYDTEAGAEAAVDLLEYANSQLLEFRHYDEQLTRTLAQAYRVLERGTGLVDRWRLSREARRLHAVTVDVGELAERADNAIKFVSDMFSARMYRLAAGKVGVPDYKRLVDNKLRTAEELYHFMVDQFHQSRAFVLELMIVIILIIDLVFLFRGK